MWDGEAVKKPSSLPQDYQHGQTYIHKDTNPHTYISPSKESCLNVTKHVILGVPLSANDEKAS